MSTPTTTPRPPRFTDAATDATATAQRAAPNSVPNPSFDDGLHEQYVEAVNHAVAEERDDLVEHLAAEYDEAMAALYKVRATQGPRPIARSAADATREHDEQEDTPNTTLSRIPALLRQVLRRLDDWTLVASTPRYPARPRNAERRPHVLRGVR
ncbi:MAG TPA: hypothetical protein VGE11_09280 [Pseudonocardia sp.]